MNRECGMKRAQGTRVVLSAVHVLLAKASFLLLYTSPSLASNVEAVSSFYSDVGRTVFVNSVLGNYETRALWRGRGRISSVSLGYTGKLVNQKEDNELITEAVGQDISKYSENSLTASLSQGWRVGSVVGGFGGLTESPLGETYYFGVQGTEWFLHETLQVNLSVQKTVSRVPIIEYTDTDGKRVTTPADLDGVTVSTSVTNFTTPTTILMGSFARSTRTDRPPADATSAEIRQYINWTRSAVHASIAHYENVGRIEPITQVGSVVSNTARLEWHQRLPRRMILMGGYRYHLETETPRASDAAVLQTGTDSIYGSWRWRFGKGSWTGTAHEVYSFLARYTTNADGLAYVVGVGGKYYF